MVSHGGPGHAPSHALALAHTEPERFICYTKIHCGGELKQPSTLVRGFPGSESPNTCQSTTLQASEKWCVATF